MIKAILKFLLKKVGYVETHTVYKTFKKTVILDDGNSKSRRLIALQKDLQECGMWV